jgi:hypothetical protein
MTLEWQGCGQLGKFPYLNRAAAARSFWERQSASAPGFCFETRQIGRMRTLNRLHISTVLHVRPVAIGDVVVWGANTLIGDSTAGVCSDVRTLLKSNKLRLVQSQATGDNIAI